MQEKAEVKEQKITVEVVYGTESLVKCMKQVIQLHVMRHEKEKNCESRQL